MPKVAMPLRVMVTGEAQTPSINAVLELLGRDETLKRIDERLASFPRVTSGKAFVRQRCYAGFIDWGWAAQYNSPSFVGGIAQLGERLHGMQEVSGSIPLTSTTDLANRSSTEDRP